MTAADVPATAESSSALDPASAAGWRPLHQSTWRITWVIVGMLALLAFRSLVFLDRDWLLSLPFWLTFILGGVAPQVFFLIYPFAAREPARSPDASESPSTPPRPGVNYYTEFCIAGPVVMATLFVIGVVNVLVEYLAPGAWPTPDILTDLARAPSSAGGYVGFLLVFMFTFVPVAEEAYFRGFLHNAFKARMPFAAAAIAQSVIFGFVHTYSLAHSISTIFVALILTAVYEWRRTLVTPILVHAGFNFIAAMGVLAMMHLYANGPAMGVSCEPNSPQCIVREVVAGSAAEQAGMQPGDVIKSFNGEPIHYAGRLTEAVVRYQIGDAVPVVIERNGQEHTLTVTLQARADLPESPNQPESPDQREPTSQPEPPAPPAKPAAPR